MSFSVGFRSKSASHMLSSLADYLIDNELGSALISDPQRPVHTQQGRIDSDDFGRIRAHMQAVLDDDTLIADFAGSFLSKNKCALDLQPLEEPFDPRALLKELKRQPLLRIGGLRCFYVDATVRDGVCYIDGERHEFGAACHGAVLALCDHEMLSHALLQAWLKQPLLVETLTEWVNCGYWYFED